MQALFNSDVTMKLTTWDLLLGNGVYGSIGEVCKLALLLGGVYLVCVGVINFRWPLVYIAVTGVVTFFLNGFDFMGAVNALLSGGLILGAVFMATDYVTSPATKTGNYICRAGRAYCGIASSRQGGSGFICNLADEPCRSSYRQLLCASSFRIPQGSQGGGKKWLTKNKRRA